jgi:N-sulfoglucosamine sulfohydrolase
MNMKLWFRGLRTGLGLIVMAGAVVDGRCDEHPRPNILWLVCEDASVEWFGCYGNTNARTPNIDRLARDGFRYTHAYASAPVCAAQRSAWITGMESLSMGTHPMRSRYAIPHEIISYYPDALRQAGYFAANHTKTDYNIGGRPDAACWDSTARRGWEQRRPGQPFFQVINFNESHESKVQGAVTNPRFPPQQVRLAKYHPDELGIRQNYAKFHDAVENMDAEIGKALQTLEQSGLAPDTIVIFSSDHGGVMPRSKRFLFDSGIHAPLIVRIPEKFKSLWPAAKPGLAVDRLVSFLDFPKTWLSLARAPISPLMQGRIFLGPNAEPEPQFVFSYRERMDERIDNQRSVRDKRFVYIKNYLPFAPWGQRLEYMWKLAAMRSWEGAWVAGRTDDLTGRFFTAKPVEELYDRQADPDNVINLATDPAHQKTLETMRVGLREWQLAIHDTALLPEGERARRAEANQLTIYELARDAKFYDLPAYLDAADVALAGKATNEEKLGQLLTNEDSGQRYWGAVGLMMLNETKATTREKLQNALTDASGEVAVMAAWALRKAGDAERADRAIARLLERDAATQLFVLNALDWMRADLAPFQSVLEKLAAGDGEENYVKRMVVDLREARRRK